MAVAGYCPISHMGAVVCAVCVLPGGAEATYARLGEPRAFGGATGLGTGVERGARDRAAVGVGGGSLGWGLWDGELHGG